MTDMQKLNEIEKLVNLWMKDDNHPKCIDQLNEILHSTKLEETTNEFLQDLILEQSEQM